MQYEDDATLDRRPAAVTIAAWLLIIPPIAMAVLFIVGMVFMITGVFGMAGRFGGGGGGFSLVLIPFMLLSMVVSMIIPTLLVLLGIALLRLRPWAQTTTIVVQVIMLLLAIGPVVYGSPIPPWQPVFAIVPIVIAVLLLLPSSREAFATAREQQMI